MNEKILQPEEILHLKSLEALKVITVPLRHQIMEMLISSPMTIKQVAGMLGEESSKLYYHFNQLEKHGFIRVVETVIQGNLIEKHYWITAHRYEMEDELLSFNVDTPEGTEQILEMLLINLNATREDLRRSIYARHYQISQGADTTPRPVLDKRIVLNLSDEKAAEFHKRLNDLTKEFAQEAKEMEADKETHPWGLQVMFYPSFYYDNDGESND